MGALKTFGLSLTICAAALGSSACADDATDLMAKAEVAQKAVQSFVLTMSGPRGIVVTTTYVAPGKTHGTTVFGSITSDTYVADGVMYLRINGGPWQSRPFDPATAAAHIHPIAPDAKRTLLPDVADGAVTYGAIKVETGPVTLHGVAVPASIMTCTFDKATLLLHECKTPQATLTYSRYNDPANVVEVPADAKANAKPLVIPGFPDQAAPSTQRSGP